MIYGYCRVSTKQQSMERQIRNILKEYPDAEIYQESYTGRKVFPRKELQKVIKKAQKGDIIVFDSVSRMSRDSGDGFKLYQELFKRGIELVFLKEPHINTETYKKALKQQIELTGTSVDCILNGINQYLLELAKEQIRLAFGQAQKEVDDLSQRTKEGIETARRAGKQIGQVTGRKLHVKKEKPAKEQIRKYSRDFYGTLKDQDVIKITGLSRNTYYKYKASLRDDLIAANQ